MSFSNGLGL